MTFAIDNFRDIGGLETEDGKHTCFGYVYRSSHLSSLPISDLVRILHENGIRRIIDFRTNDEIKKYGSYPENFGIEVEYIRSPIQCEGLIKDDIAVRERGLFGDRYLYYHLLKNETGTFKKTIDLISNAEDRPLIIHCIAGKDRTGIVIALLLLAMNVKREKIIEDYLLTPRANVENLHLLLNLIEESGGVFAYLNNCGVEQSTIDKIKFFLVR